MTVGTEVDVEKVFDDEFARAAADAEKGIMSPAEPKVDEKPAENKAVISAENAEEEAAAKKAEEEASAKKAEEEAAAKREEELAALSPEDRAKREAEEADAARVKQEGEEAAARLKKKAEDEAAAKAAEEKKAAEAEAAKETPEQKKAREEFEASIAPYEPTAEEKAALEQFKKDFPNEAVAVEARIRAADRAAKKYAWEALQTVIDYVNGRLSPVEESTQNLSLKEHLETLHKAHPDYDQVIEKIPEWIKQQPALLQPTLQAAYDEGDTQSVLDLVASYKASVGAPASKGKSETQLAAEQKAADEAAAKKKKADEEAAALAPVKSKRTNTNPTGSKDPNDFDGAFEEAAAAAAGGK